MSLPVACCVSAIDSRVQLGEATVLAQPGVVDMQLPDAAVPECADAEESEDDAVERCDHEGRDRKSVV